jgi:glycosyltransferase involved in cell wall biosynthesis
MVATSSLKEDLQGFGFRNLVSWSRGVDTELFRPRPKEALDLPRPNFLCVGRVAIEKNLEAFLELDLPGSKVVIGDGPDLPKLKAAHPEAHFLGAKEGEDLARHFAAADVFVFPSRTDTFGLVLLEAMASGLPVAAYPVTGPLDVVVQGRTGFLDEDLGKAARAALELSPEACREHALGYSWHACAAQFLSHITPSHPIFGHAEQAG